MQTSRAVNYDVTLLYQLYKMIAQKTISQKIINKQKTNRLDKPYNKHDPGLY